VTPIITLTTTPNPSLIGQVVTLTVAFAPPPGTNPATFPSGLFTIKLDGAPFQTYPASTGLLVPTAAIPGGLHSLTVEYNGDGRYNPAVSNTVLQDVRALLFVPLVAK
jgi:hypothetical protein